MRNSRKILFNKRINDRKISLWNLLVLISRTY